VKAVFVVFTSSCSDMLPVVTYVDPDEIRTRCSFWIYLWITLWSRRHIL